MHRTQLPTVSAADVDDNTLTVTPALILRGAALYLENHGWVQSTYYGGDTNTSFPPACADGAIGMAAFGGVTTCPGREGDNPNFRDYNRAFHYFTGYLHRSGWKLPCDPWCAAHNDDCLCDNGEAEIVFAWNDDDTRNGLQVVIALNAAADDYDRTHPIETCADQEPMQVPLTDTGGYLNCGCHGSQRDHTCGPRD